MDFQDDVLQQLHLILRELAELKTNQKEILNSKEAIKYLGCSPSYLYKLTHRHQIPCYQPNGKMLFFKRSELDEWLLRNKKYDKDAIGQMAANYVASQPRKRTHK